MNQGFETTRIVPRIRILKTVKKVNTVYLNPYKSGMFYWVNKFHTCLVLFTAFKSWSLLKFCNRSGFHLDEFKSVGVSFSLRQPCLHEWSWFHPGMSFISGWLLSQITHVNRVVPSVWLCPWRSTRSKRRSSSYSGKVLTNTCPNNNTEIAWCFVTLVL